MAAADDSRPDLYQLLGVTQDASRQDIGQAWRRRARDEHPDSRPRDAAAAERFRAVAEAYEVLSDPARRAAYDLALARARQPAPGRPPAPGGTWPVGRAPGPPLWAGPVQTEPLVRPQPSVRVGPTVRPGPSARPGRVSSGTVGGGDEEAARLAVLAALALRYLAWDRDWPW